MAETDWIVVNLEHSPDKKVRVPRSLVEKGVKFQLSARAYAVESGQATWEEVNGAPAAVPGASGNFDAAMIGAGRQVDNLKSNFGQALADITGNKASSQLRRDEQTEISRLSQPLKSEFPKSSFAGEMLPSFVIPGGLGMQVGAGAIEGALTGDTAKERIGGGALGGTLGFLGQKAGDFIGSRIQNKAQSVFGNPNASAREALLASKVPLALSERTDGPISKPLARFFERGQFVLTGSQPKGAAQQARLTEMLTEALGISDKKLTREALGKAVTKNTAVFQNAADRAGGQFFPDSEFLSKIDDIASAFDDVGSDSAQVKRVFDSFTALKNADVLEGIDARKLLKLRSNLSEATTKTDIETSAVVDAISSIDDLISRNVPMLADDLMVARDRFRLLLALRRGAALSPQGDINSQTFTKNLERVFRDFDVNKPLPRSLGPVGETMAGFNQVTNPFRSSGTAENLAALGLPGAGASDPSVLLKILSGFAAPFAGGGTGALIGGGASRAQIRELLEKAGMPSEI